MRSTIAAIFLSLATVSTSAFTGEKAAELELTGGPPWTNRVGPGLMASVSGNDCTDVFCENQWRTGYWGSIGGSVGFYYRILANLVVLAEANLGRVKTGANWLDEDMGLLFGAAAAAEFHGPIMKWLDSYVGFGIAYSHLRFQGESAQSGGQTDSLQGINFELRTGLDFYPFMRAPKLGMGPFFKLGMPWWIHGCTDAEGEKTCGYPNDVGMDDLPFLVHFGFAVKVGF